MKTIATKVNNDVYYPLLDECSKRGITISEKLRELVINQGKLGEPIDLDKTIEHMKECPNCNKAMISKGYILVSLEELKKYNLEPAKNPILKALVSM